ncbi:MAG: Maf family protein [Deltaproteobacteria bacterium]
MLQIILASSSPRRKELLEQLGLEFRVISSNVDETTEEENPYRLAEKLAEIKAREVARNLEPGYLVVGADTIVCLESEVLGKPRDEAEAIGMLKKLSGNTHRVITGVALIQPNSDRSIVFHEETLVKFKKLTDEEIRSYIRTGEPMDKAGAYGIQKIGAILVEKIDGCYFNVVGLPLTRLTEKLKEFNINIL